MIHEEKGIAQPMIHEEKGIAPAAVLQSLFELGFEGRIASR